MQAVGAYFPALNGKDGQVQRHEEVFPAPVLHHAVALEVPKAAGDLFAVQMIG